MPFNPIPQDRGATHKDEEFCINIVVEHIIHIVLSLPTVHLPGAQVLSQAEHYSVLFNTLNIKFYI